MDYHCFKSQLLLYFMSGNSDLGLPAPVVEPQIFDAPIMGSRDHSVFPKSKVALYIKAIDILFLLPIFIA